nr:venom-related protein Kazal protease inhibitor [Conus judaeus]
MKTAVCIFLTVLALAHGETEDECGPEMCTMEYMPYCLTFRKTLSNKCNADIETCTMRARGYTLVSTQACECDIVCTAQYDPVCGRDLTTNTTKVYSNECALRAQCKRETLVEVPMDECPEPFH